MTQSQLDFTAPRETLNDKLARFFRRNRGAWLDVADLAAIAGIGGWRSRVCELRFPPYSMDIRNSQERWPDGRRRSVYRFQPAESQEGKAAA